MKKITTLLFAPIMFMMVMSISSCKKYDEGPAFSLSSKKSRVVNEWKMTKYEMNGKDYTQEIKDLAGGDVIYEFKKDDSYTAFVGGQIMEKGTWDFTDSKKGIVMTSSDGETQIWTIDKLTKNDLWVNFTDDDGLNEIQFETK